MWRVIISIGLINGFAALSGCFGLQQPLESKGISAGPQNDARLVGESVTLQCITSNNNTLISWVEYASGNPAGTPISLGENVLVEHPSSERYKIIHDEPDEYNLHINATVDADGGTYKCVDVGTQEEAYAELIMIIGNPVCESTVPTDGAVLEGYVYSVNCSVKYRGNVAPTMTWTGARQYAIESSTTNESVWSKVTFTATRMITATYFSCKTNFTDAGFGGTNAATNIPTYEYVSEGNFLRVYCSCAGTTGPSTTLIQQSDGTDRAFDRPWDDFKAGFSVPNCYWLGNDLLSIATQEKKCSARFELQAEYDGLWYVSEYETFIVGNESTQYQLTIGDQSGNTTDGMRFYNGLKFTTKDRDNDNYTNNNCASLYLGAWWYGDCFMYRLIMLQKSSGYFGWPGLPGLNTIRTKVWLICS